MLRRLRYMVRAALDARAYELDGRTLVVPVRFAPLPLAELIDGVDVDFAWMQLVPRADRSFDWAYRVAEEQRVHLLDQPFVQRTLLSAYDLLRAVDEEEFVPDEIGERAEAFHRAIDAAGLER